MAARREVAAIATVTAVIVRRRVNEDMVPTFRGGEWFPFQLAGMCFVADELHRKAGKMEVPQKRGVLPAAGHFLGIRQRSDLSDERSERCLAYRIASVC